MRIPVSDEFLWDIFKLFNAVDDVADFVFKQPTMYNWLPGPKNPIYKKYRHDKNKRRFGDLVYYLKRRGYIKVKNLEGRKAVMITKDGISKVLKASFVLDKAKKRKDGKWIMIIFDIPQKRKKDRELLRGILQNAGYKMFQQSVWISPYDVYKKTERLLQMHNLENYVKIFLTEEL